MTTPQEDPNFSFYRSELRVLQKTCKDNEEFLNRVADILARKDAEVDGWRDQYGRAQQKLDNKNG